MELITTTEGLAAGATAHGAHAVEVEGMAAGTAVATSAVLPGTLRPAVIEGTARVVAHGANKLAVSTAGSALVAAVSAAIGENGIAYGITEDANAAALLV